MFKLKEIEKEVMLYNFYTRKVVENPERSLIEGCWERETKQCNQKKIEQCKKNIISAGLSDNEFFNTR